MFPLSDSTPHSRIPVVTYLIIFVTIMVFFVQLSVPDFEAFILNYAFIPALFSPFSVESWHYVLYSIFLHGGFLHILSNLWFLKIFGDNVEDRLGHLGFAVFYLAGGVIAVLSQYILDTGSYIPLIGASGAISAAAGFYAVHYSHSRVRTLITAFYFIRIIEIPVWLFLGYWFFIQIISGFGTIASGSADSGGVAYMAHIGGFLFGFFIGKLFTPRQSFY